MGVKSKRIDDLLRRGRGASLLFHSPLVLREKVKDTVRRRPLASKE